MLPLPSEAKRATGVFRVATKCGYGPTKGEEGVHRMLLTSGPMRGVIYDYDGGQSEFPLATFGNVQK